MIKYLRCFFGFHVYKWTEYAHVKHGWCVCGQSKFIDTRRLS